jgi:hypothetical protein
MTQEQALSMLTLRDRNLLRLRDEEHLTWPKIGKAIGIHPKYAAVLHKAAALRLAELTADMQPQPELPAAPEPARTVVVRGVPVENPYEQRVMIVRGVPVDQIPTHPDFPV